MSRFTVLFVIVLGGACLFAASQGAPAATSSVDKKALRPAYDLWHAADAQRLSGKYDNAIKAYEKSVEVLTKVGGPGNPMAEAPRQMVEFCKAMPIDVKKLKDGDYEGSARSTGGDVTVAVTVKGGKIKELAIKSQKDDRPRDAYKVLPALIVKKQTPSVDAVTGATISSYAVMSATERALVKARDAAEPEKK